MATPVIRKSRRGDTVYRSAVPFALLQVIFWGLLIAMIAVLAVGPGRHVPRGDWFAGPLFMGCIIYPAWVGARHLTVRVGEAGIVVENVFVRHVIPWGNQAYFVVDRGLFVQMPGRLVTVQAWPRSAGSAMVGYGAYNKVRDKLQAECSRAVDAYYHPGGDVAPYRWRVVLPDWPVLPLFFVLLEGVALISYYAHVG